MSRSIKRRNMTTGKRAAVPHRRAVYVETTDNPLVELAGCAVGRRDDVTIILVWHELTIGEIRELLPPLLQPVELVRLCWAYRVPLPPAPIDSGLARSRMFVPASVRLCRERHAR